MHLVGTDGKVHVLNTWRDACHAHAQAHAHVERSWHTSKGASDRVCVPEPGQSRKYVRKATRQIDEVVLDSKPPVRRDTEPTWSQVSDGVRSAPPRTKQDGLETQTRVRTQCWEAATYSNAVKRVKSCNPRLKIMSDKSRDLGGGSQWGVEAGTGKGRGGGRIST